MCSVRAIHLPIHSEVEIRNGAQAFSHAAIDMWYQTRVTVLHRPSMFGGKTEERRANKHISREGDLVLVLRGNAPLPEQMPKTTPFDMLHVFMTWCVSWHLPTTQHLRWRWTSVPCGVLCFGLAAAGFVLFSRRFGSHMLQGPTERRRCLQNHDERR